MDARTVAKVLGKICPRCGQAGAVLYETENRIIYECPDQHQYETIKIVAGKTNLKLNFSVVDKPRRLG
jgi:hypothetical protein